MLLIDDEMAASMALARTIKISLRNWNPVQWRRAWISGWAIVGWTHWLAVTP
jgi:hypothetical protein